jgi:competence protein ComGC
MEVVSMMAEGTKIHEKRSHTFISFFMAVICFLVGLQYIGAAETRQTGIIAVVMGVLLVIAAIYMFFAPMIVLGYDKMYFKSGNLAKKDIPYSEIASWTLRGDKNKQLIFQLKSDKEMTEDEKKKNTITINYLNMDKNNQKILIDVLSKRGIEQVITVEPAKKSQV